MIILWTAEEIFTLLQGRYGTEISRDRRKKNQGDSSRRLFAGRCLLHFADMVLDIYIILAVLDCCPLDQNNLLKSLKLKSLRQTQTI